MEKYFENIDAFGNVFTPFYNFEEYEQEIDERKMKRLMKLKKRIEAIKNNI